MNNSMQLQVIDTEASRERLMEQITGMRLPSTEVKTSQGKRGRPQQVEWMQILLGLLMSVVCGMSNYQQLWRRLRRQGVAGYEPVKVQDDAIIKRLKKAGLEPFEEFFGRLGKASQASQEAPSACSLAPFATEIVAIDEMTGEQMQRHLKEQRHLPPGDKGLLPGKLAGRLNLRSQQWELVQWQEDAQANCKAQMLSLLKGLAAGSLLVFDLGYFSFAWFDYLSERGYWWISRLREGTSYRLVHTFYRYEGVLDALIWLGAYRANQAGEVVRLVRFWDGKHLHCYISNVLDPRQLSMKEIAQIYARRWDIELAFLLLKKYLGLSRWWSSQPVLMQQQCLATLIVAQLLQGMRLQMAKEAGVDAFAVSLPLLVEVLPEVLMEGWEPMEWMRRYGVELGLIRPSSRLEPVVPEIREEEMVMPAGELAQRRKARYPRYVVVEEGEEGDATISKTGTAKKRAKKKPEASKKTRTKGEEVEKKERRQEARRDGKEEEERKRKRETEKEGEMGKPAGAERDQKKQKGRKKNTRAKEAAKTEEKGKNEINPSKRETTHKSRIVSLVDT